MRILFVEPFGKHGGHHSPESQRATEALADCGARVTMVTFDGVIGNWMDTARLEGSISIGSKYGLNRLLRFISTLGQFLLIKPFTDLLETASTTFLAFWQSRKQSCDAIHFFDGNPAFAVPLTAAILTKRRNLVLNIYAPPPGWEVTSWLRSLAYLLKKRDYWSCLRLIRDRLTELSVIKLVRKALYQRAMARNRCQFICHATEIKEAYREYLGGLFYDKIHVIPLGRKQPEQEIISTRQAREYLHLPQDAKVFLHFGSYHAAKNIRVIFQAVQDMPKTLFLFFVGWLGTWDNVRNPALLAQEYGWAENTIVINEFVPEEEKHYYFRASDAIILSYIKGSVISVSILNDACQFALPVIASDVGQLGEYVTTYGLGTDFAPDDPDSLRQAIASFLNLTEAEILAIRANFHRFASDLSWEKVAKRYMALYSRDLSARKGG